MTLFAGLYLPDSQEKIDPAKAALINREISRTKGEIDVFSNQRFHLVKYDCGAFKESGYHKRNDAVSALAGEPYSCAIAKGKYSRFNDLKMISKELDKGNLDCLRSCNGTYSLCYYNSNEHSLILATDKLGVRPLYYLGAALLERRQC